MPVKLEEMDDLLGFIRSQKALNVSMKQVVARCHDDKQPGTRRARSHDTVRNGGIIINGITRAQVESFLAIKKRAGPL